MRERDSGGERESKQDREKLRERLGGEREIDQEREKLRERFGGERHSDRERENLRERERFGERGRAIEREK